MARSKSPTVRALDELKHIHELECGHIMQEVYASNEAAINSVNSNVERNAVEQVVRAINSLDIPYTLEHTTVCNVRNYNGTLRFELKFNGAKSKECRNAFHANTEILSRRREALNRLEQWYLKSLYDVAGRGELEEFKV